MSDNPVQYSLHDGIATIRIDDGKRNALAPDVLQGIYKAFDQAERDNAAVIITGRDDVFSAGFDLNVMKRGGLSALKMLRLGYGLTARVMNYPYPTVAACNGHVLAMGVFLMLSCDYRIGTRGNYKISANEVAIGMTMPRVAAATLHHRLTPNAFQKAVVLAEYFDSDSAVSAGFFDELVHRDDLQSRALAETRELQKLNQHAHRKSKRRIRKKLIRKIRRSVWLDLFDALLVALRR